MRPTTTRASRRKRLALGFAAVLSSIIFYAVFIAAPWGFWYTSLPRPICEAGEPDHVNEWGYLGTTGGWKADWDFITNGQDICHPDTAVLRDPTGTLHDDSVHEVQHCIYIATDGGRVCRPLIIVDGETGKLRLKQSHIKEVEDGLT